MLLDRRFIALFVFTFVACKKSEQPKPAPKTELVAPAVVSPSSSAPPAVSVEAQPPKLEAPGIACTESKVVAFRASPDESFGCSPFKTGTDRLELTMAPGTTLELDLALVMAEEKKAAKEAEKKKDAAGDAGDDIDVPTVFALDKVTFKSAGLPKGAFLDAKEEKLTWPVAGADGDSFAFRLAGFVSVDGKNECVTAPVIVHVKDDVTRRQAQLARILPRDAGEANRPSDCGGLDLPVMADLDGDGLADGYWTIGNRYDNDSGTTHVWFRRGDKFVHVAQLTQKTTLYRAPDNTALFMARGGCCCHEDLTIWKVFSNRVDSIVGIDMAGDCSTSKAEISVSVGGGILSAYSTSYTSPTGSSSSSFEWDTKSKRFIKK